MQFKLYMHVPIKLLHQNFGKFEHLPENVQPLPFGNCENSMYTSKVLLCIEEKNPSARNEETHAAA